MVELIIIIGVLFFVGKYILLNVRVNSVIFILFGIVALSLRPPLIPISWVSIILLAINIIDCIRDIAIADKFYKDMSDGIDKQFAIKSLTTVALLLLGWFFWDRTLIYAFIPRIVFLCIVDPLIAMKVKEDVQGKVEIGYPLPYSKWRYSRSVKECYYYQKLVKRLFDEGKLVANRETVMEECNESRKKLSDKYPKTIVARVMRTIKNDKEIKEEINNVTTKLDNAVYRHTAYISSAYFEQYASKIARVLKNKNAAFSPWKIKELIELEDLNLTAANGYVGDVEWSEYFIIQSLKQLVRNGIINDFKCSDEPLNNHAYGVAMTSRDASNDPRLSLDDD